MHHIGILVYSQLCIFRNEEGALLSISERCVTAIVYIRSHNFNLRMQLSQIIGERDECLQVLIYLFLMMSAKVDF